MKSKFNTGSATNLNFFLAGSILNIIMGIVYTRIPLPLLISFIVFALFITLFLGANRKKRFISEYAHMRVQSIAFVVLDAFLAVSFNSAQVLVYALSFSVITIFTFLDVKIAKFHMIVSVLSALAAAGLISVYTGSQQTMLAYTFGSCMVLVMNWVILSMTTLISFNYRQGREQERSLDDLLKVLEAKCDQAQAATRSKSRFLANMSHEIRTPINAVMGMNEMILRESREPAIREYASETKIAAGSLLNIINDILDISKIEEGKLTIISAKYKPVSLLTDLYTLFRFRAEAKNLKLEFIIDEELPSVMKGDDVRLKEILSNLISNAIKYTHHGSVTLEVRKIGEEDIYFCVRDTGIGIKEEDIGRLFDAFDRIEENRNRSIQGTGLGLNITSSLLKLMNSEIRVKSYYGMGSEFSFVLKQEIIDPTPIGKPDLTHEYDDRQYEATFTAPSAKLLVVDDNAINRKVFTNLLKQTKALISEADSGKQCLEMIQDTKYDMIFMDHMMPEMDGVETLKAIRAMSGNINIGTPIIALTANALSGSKEYYLSEGFDGFLSKPIDPKKLEKLISNVLSDMMLTSSDDSEAEKAELPVIEGIDWSYARGHFAEDEPLLDAIKLLHTSIKGDADELNSYYADLENEGMLDSYRIKVHSMKSSAALVGIVQLAGMAMELENAARNGNVETIRALHPVFIQRWLCFEPLLKELVSDDSEPKKDSTEHSAEIAEIFNRIHNSALEMDVDALDELSAMLDGYSFPESEEEKIAQLKRMILNFDIEGLLKFDY